MSTQLITDDEARHIFRYWRASLCPCCGSELDGTEPAVVAEDVELCGRCISGRHHRGEAGAELLAAIVRGRQLTAQCPSSPAPSDYGGPG